MNARSVVDRILMNRAILAGADTDYSELRSDTEYFHEKRDARSIESRGNRVRRVSWIFDLVPFPTLPAICLLHPREDFSLSLPPFSFPFLSFFLSFFPSYGPSSSSLSSAYSKLHIRHEQNHKSFSLQLGDARARPVRSERSFSVLVVP